MKLFIVFLAAFNMAIAGVYNIKLLNDNQPDYSDCESFMKSVTHGWTTNQEKAISMWKWTQMGRVQMGAYMHEHEGMYPDLNKEFDMITYLNSCGGQICSGISASLGIMWTNYTGNYFHLNKLSGHTTCDVYYDNGWHMLDASVNNYVFNLNGEIASRDELHNDPNLYYYHCPQRTSDGPAGTIYGDHRSMDDMNYCYTDPKEQKPNFGTAMNQVCLGMRPYEYYKRYKDPIGTTKDYYYYEGTDEHPNERRDNQNVQTNGEWVLEPDLSASDWQEAVFDVNNITQGSGSPAVHPAAAGQDAEIVFNINSYNVITSMDVQANVVKGASDEAELLLSLDAGNSWTSLGNLNAGNNLKHLRDEISRKRCYLLKFRFKASSSLTGVGLSSVKIRTVTQINRLTFFKLDRGNNKVFVKLGKQLERVELRPNCEPGYYGNYIHSQVNMTGHANTYYARITTADKNTPTGYVTYKIDAPGDIKQITMAGQFCRHYGNQPICLYYSIDGGNTWTKFTNGDVQLGTGYYDGGAAFTKFGDHFAVEQITQSNVRSILFKCEVTTGTTDNQRNGLNALWMAADYEPTNISFRPLEISLNWTENRWNGTKVTRGYVKRIGSYGELSVFDINVLGYRFPKMNYVTVNLVGHNPDGNSLPEGYSDGQDVGNVDEISTVYYVKSNRISTGKSVISSVPPRDAKYLLSYLTDEFVSKIKANGESVFWSANANPVLALDLGSSMTFQGVTVFQGTAYDYGEYSDSIQIHTGDDLNNLTYQGTLSKYDLWNWPGDFTPPEHWEKMTVEDNFRLFIRGYDFPLSFGKDVTARYVVFKVFNSATVILRELRVWETMEKKAWPGDVFDHGSGSSIDHRFAELVPFAGNSGLQIQAYPNPFRSSVVIRALAGNTIRSLEVYDVRGRMIYKSSRGAVHELPVLNQFVWEGVDGHGRRVANGNYFIKVKTANSEASPRVNLVR